MSGEERGENREEEYRYIHIDIDIDKVGRPKAFFDKKHIRNVVLYVNQKNRLLYGTLKEILRREKRSFSSWVLENAESYVRLHEPGNPQQRLDTIIKLGKAYHAPSKICGYKDCLRNAVAVGFYIPKKEEYGLCQKHLKEARANPKVWKVLEALK